MLRAMKTEEHAPSEAAKAGTPGGAPAPEQSEGSSERPWWAGWNPDWLTTALVCVVAGATILLWGASRLACNYNGTMHHPPRPVAFEERVQTAKGAALEFELALARGNAGDAERLADDALRGELRQLTATCTDKPSSCPADAVVEGVAEVVRLGDGEAVVRVETDLAGKREGHRLVLAREDASWRVKERSLYEPGRPPPEPELVPAAAAGGAPSAGGAPAAPGTPSPVTP